MQPGWWHACSCAQVTGVHPVRRTLGVVCRVVRLLVEDSFSPGLSFHSSHRLAVVYTLSMKLLHQMVPVFCTPGVLARGFPKLSCVPNEVYLCLWPSDECPVLVGIMDEERSTFHFQYWFEHDLSHRPGVTWPVSGLGSYLFP